MLAYRLGEDIAIYVNIGDQQLSVTASIGVAVTTSGDEDPSTLIQKADAAMYVAKENGRDRTQLFNERLRARALEQVEFEQDLLEAIMGAQLRLKYQPIVRLSDNVVIGVEALVRWEHPERGLLEPESFVPWAEDSGLVAQLDAWVLTEASRQAAAWLKAIPGLGAFRLWVNRSGATFLRHNTLESVLEILGKTGFPSHALGIEITEHVFMSDTERMRVTLEGMMAHDISIAIDDFGTGFSSLGYLKRFPVDVVKIDRMFVGGIGSEPESSLVAAFLGMARSLGITTVAEGVELEEQRGWLAREGCDNAQGHLFSHPLDAADVTRLLVTSGGGARVMQAILGNQTVSPYVELQRAASP
jgi:EAL domain-containing protein (putative c-di-GMP-specific phosphodiesterase class I)